MESTIPPSHSGAGTVFTLEVEFSEDIDASYLALRDQALLVTNGDAQKFRRVNGSNSRWEIHVEPSSSLAVTLTIPVTTDCSAADAICTADDRRCPTGCTGR